MGNKRQVGLALSESNLRRRYPSSKPLKDIEIDLDHSLRLPSRVLSFNYQTGCLPYGHILELYGEENVGKTLMAIDYAYSAQQLGGVVLWDDAEGTFSPHWGKANGLNLPKIEMFSSKGIEEIADWIADMIVYYRSKLTRNQPILLVIDSLAALETIENLSMSQVDQKAQMGNRAKAIDNMLRNRTKFFHDYGVCVIAINQLRSKIGASKFEDPDVTPGGKAMKFYASQRLGLYGGKILRDDNKKRFGRVTYSRLKKTKTGIPRDNIQLEVIFKPIDHRPVGYSKYAGFIEILVELAVIERRRGGAYYYKGEMIARGEAAMEKAFRTNDKLRKNLIRRSKVLTISMVKEQLDAIKENRYPVNVKKGKSDSPTNPEDEDEEE